MIPRPLYAARLRKALRRSPIVALLGPRQCGKTTLARALDPDHYYDLESQPDLRKLANPELVLGGERGLVVLDEVQKKPELFEVLRVLVDRPDAAARFLILGSASPDVVRGASETLAGRVEMIELAPFDLWELGPENLDRRWIRGGFPRSFLAADEEDSFVWRENFIQTFLERDLAEVGVSIPPVAMRRFWTMLAHDHGQTWNASRLGRAMGLSDKTVRGYLDLLTGTYMIRQLQPWFANLGKRQVRSPKTYLRDSGILHALLGLQTRSDLLGHPSAGSSWEGFAIEQIVRWTGDRDVWFWATHTGAELDLLVIRGGRRYGFELKFSEAPAVSRSMRIAMTDLKLEHLWIVTPGRHRYRIDDAITVLPLAALGAEPGLPQGR